MAPEGGLTAGGSVSYAYRQFWCWTPPAQPDLAIARARAWEVGKRRRFVVEFVSDPSPTRKGQRRRARRSKPRRDKSSLSSVYPYKDRRSVRVVFDLDPGSESYSELRLVLKAANKPVSETWLYRWTA